MNPPSKGLFENLPPAPPKIAPDFSALIPEYPEGYVENKEVDRPVAFFLSAGSNVAILGDPASGKTEGIIAYAARNGIPLFQQSGAADLGSHDVRGAMTLVDGETRFIPGQLTAAMEISHLCPNGAMYMLDEVTAVEACILSMLFSVADRRKMLYIPETGEVKIASDKFRVVVCGNVEGAHVRASLSDAMRSRFQVITVNDAHALKVTSERFVKVADDLGATLPKRAENILQEMCKEIRAAGGHADARDLYRATKYLEQWHSQTGEVNGAAIQKTLEMAFAGTSDKPSVIATAKLAIASRFGDTTPSSKKAK